MIDDEFRETYGVARTATGAAEPTTDSYAARFKACRKAAGLTQTECAEKIYLTRSSVANIEGGRQRSVIEDVERFAAVFGVEPAWLAFGRVTVGGPPPLPPPIADLLACANDLHAVANRLTKLATHPSEADDSEE